MDGALETTQETTPVATTETTTATQTVDTGAANTGVDAGAANTGDEGAGEEENPYLLTVEEDEETPAAGAEAALTAPDEALKSYLEISPYINSPEALQGAVADSHLLWDVINGQVPPGDILKNLETANPQAWQSVVNGLASYIAEKTGFQFVDPKAAPKTENVDPAQARIDALEQRFKDEQTAREQQIITQRATASQRVLVGHLSEALKGSAFEGEDFLPLIASKLGDPMKVIEGIEKGDFSSINKAIKAAKKEETDKFNARLSRISKQRQSVANGLPKLGNPGTKKQSRADQFDMTTREGRIAAITAAAGA